MDSVAFLSISAEDLRHLVKDAVGEALDRHKAEGPSPQPALSASPSSAASNTTSPGFRRGSARSAARLAVRWPALSPSKHRVGSSVIFQSSVS